MRLLDPSRDCFPRLLGDLKLHRSLGFLLHDNCPRRNRSTLDNVVDAKSDQIAPAQLTVDRKVEQREFPGSMIQLQSNPDGPDFLSFSGGFWPSSLPLFHGIERPAIVERYP